MKTVADDVLFCRHKIDVVAKERIAKRGDSRTYLGALLVARVRYGAQRCCKRLPSPRLLARARLGREYSAVPSHLPRFHDRHSVVR